MLTSSELEAVNWFSGTARGSIREIRRPFGPLGWPGSKATARQSCEPLGVSRVDLVLDPQGREVADHGRRLIPVRRRKAGSPPIRSASRKWNRQRTGSWLDPSRKWQ